MKYCTRCLYPANHPYGLIFDAEGVCSGCRVHEEKDVLDWEARFRRLEAIAHENAKRVAGRGFDCIVPVFGGGDSYFTVHIVKNVLGLNPLLVHYNSQYNTRRGIRNLANLATVFDCDMVTSTLSPALVKHVTRHTLRRHGSIYWQVLAGMLTFPVQVSVKFRIPLIIWGVHPWSDQTGMYSHLDEVEMTERCRKEHGLMGLAAEDLIDEAAGVTRRDVQPWVYPFDNELEAVGVRGLYLSNYVRWDSKAQHEIMIDRYGYEAAPRPRTFNTYEDVHCFHSAGLHDWLKFLRLGYGKVTDHACREIRLRRMRREQGIAEVERYTTVPPPDLPLFLDWAELETTEFEKLVSDRRDERIWARGPDGEWSLRDSVAAHAADAGVEEARLPLLEDACEFRVTPSAEPSVADEEYILMGRGYIDPLNYGAVEPVSPGGGMTPREWRRRDVR
jgi:N-acetyl sugar amidotransferase